ncbi:trans-resveratrol di-O-methyltransferase-like [Telopea speciosissima]|uniref:trans-resveratrol di-O-methyltransferase-like n=1 Tax=Telopea speciosissima TaxID=54955 RepID=UPI001CC70A3C|nr:trans-resveratrol di-O-methyltransferase-like [Telopea speciosissima]
MDLIEKESGEELFHAQAHIWNHIFGFINSMSLGCAVQLGIPDIVHNHPQPITLSELVMKLAIPKTKTACLFRLMRLLVHSGFFATREVCKYQEEEEEGYVLTPSSRILLKDNAKSMSPFLRAMLDPILLTPWNFLSAWFQGDGLNPFETAHGRNLWDYAGEDNEFNKFFNEAMASDARLVMSVVVTECKVVFEGLKSLIDVGGGTGTVAKTIAETFPSLKCSVFDLPHVVATLEGNENLNYIKGDMFESIPHADAVLLKWILHDWNDEQCIKILKGCKEAISGGDMEGNSGKVIIIEMVVEDRKVDHKSTETQLFFDMLMMTLVTGKERTEKEWEKLFLESGFTHYKITPLLGLRSLIEVYP